MLCFRLCHISARTRTRHTQLHTQKRVCTSLSSDVSCPTNNTFTPPTGSFAILVLIFRRALFCLTELVQTTYARRDTCSACTPTPYTCVRAASGCVFSGNIINGVCLGCRKHLPTALSENRRTATPPHLPPLKQPEDFSRAPCLERLHSPSSSISLYLLTTNCSINPACIHIQTK